VCSAGKCGIQCAAPLVKCGNACIDVDANPQHCGKCNESCESGESCTAGECTKCGAGQTRCKGRCVNTLIDPAHCGRCSRACDLSCLLGICI
jgi:hypothetical protein